MAAVMLALTIPEWFDLGVAIGTALLAASTFWMAKHVKDQARETRRLAEIAERQLGVSERQHRSSTEPRLRIIRDPGGPRVTESSELAGAIVAFYENKGAGPATVIAAHLDGVEGEIRTSPDVKSGDEVVLDFDTSVLADQERTIRVAYQDVETNGYIVVTILRRVGDGDFHFVREYDE